MIKKDCIVYKIQFSYFIEEESSHHHDFMQISFRLNSSFVPSPKVIPCIASFPLASPIIYSCQFLMLQECHFQDQGGRTFRNKYLDVSHELCQLRLQQIRSCHCPNLMIRRLQVVCVAISSELRSTLLQLGNWNTLLHQQVFQKSHEHTLQILYYKKKCQCLEVSIYVWLQQLTNMALQFQRGQNIKEFLCLFTICRPDNAQRRKYFCCVFAIPQQMICPGPHSTVCYALIHQSPM